MNGGKLIVFEGIDGCGKSTQLGLLGDALGSAGHAVVRTREPYDCEAGRRIRTMARSGEPVAPEVELAWFQEQRREHVRDVLAPALGRGEIVLCDRYYLSTVAYQGARGLDWQKILAHSRAAFPEPDLVVLVEVAAEQGMQRVSARGETHEPVFEEETFLAKAAAIFDELDLPWLERVDGNGTPDAVAAAVAAAVRRRLPGLL